MSQPNAMTKTKPLNDLELYELFVAAYPERFNEDAEGGDDLWDSVMEFIDELCEEMDQSELRRLLGRIVMLTMPMQAAISGAPRHALGTIEIHDGKAFMSAAVTRDAASEAPPT